MKTDQSHPDQSSSRSAALAALLGVAMATAAQATTIPLTNPSFETPAGGYIENYRPTGWTHEYGKVWSMPDQHGSGSQCLMSFWENGWFRLSQQSTYTVAAAGETITAGLWGKVSNLDLGTANYEVVVTIGGVPVATNSMNVTANIDWTSLTVDYVTTAADIGQAVGIAVGTDGGDTAGSPSYCRVDDVSLTTVTPGGPTADGVAEPNPVNLHGSVLFTVTVVNGDSPTISSVVLNASPIGGSSSVALVAVGDGTYTNTVTVNSATVYDTSMTLSALVTDGAGLTCFAYIPLTVNAPGGGKELTWTAAVSTTWDAATANWTDNSLAAAWVNSLGTPDSALFGAAGAGSVNMSFASTFYASNITFNAAGYDITGAATLGNAPNIVANSDAKISAVLSGSSGSGLTKSGSGTLSLAAMNPYTGNTTINGGTLALTNGGGIYAGGWNGSAVLTVQSNSVLLLDKWGFGPGVQSLGGLDYNPARFIINGGTVKCIGGAAAAPTNPGEAPFGPGFTIGEFGATLDAAKADDTWTVKNDSRGYGPITSTAAGLLTLTGVGDGIFDKSLPGDGGVTKTGAGTWTLSQACTYTGATVVNAGTLRVNSILDSPTVTVTAGALGGSGTVAGSVTINSGAALAPGATATGTDILTINSDLVLNGNLKVNINNSLVQSNSMVTAYGTITCNGLGTITVTNVGPALLAGDKFFLFNTAVPGAGTMSIVAPAGYTFANNLATDGSITATAVPVVAQTLGFENLGGGQLQFTWTGSGTLQVQTNALSTGLSNNWVDYPGASPVTVTVDSSAGSVFFRLKQ